MGTTETGVAAIAANNEATDARIREDRALTFLRMVSINALLFTALGPLNELDSRRSFSEQVHFDALDWDLYGYDIDLEYSLLAVSILSLPFLLWRWQNLKSRTEQANRVAHAASVAHQRA